MKRITERLYDLREDHDAKQYEIAKLLGVTQQQYSKYENGENDLSAKTLETIANHYQVSVN